MELKPSEYRQDLVDLESIRAIRRSRRREDLDEGVNERLDKIEIQLKNGQYVSKEDRLFVLKHSMESDNNRRYHLMHKEESAHFEARDHEVENERATTRMQEQIRKAKEEYMTSLYQDALMGNFDIDKITKTNEAINRLEQLSADTGEVDVKQPHLRTEAEKQENQRRIDAFEKTLQQEVLDNEASQAMIDSAVEASEETTRASTINEESRTIRANYMERDDKTQEEEEIR